MSFLKDTVMVTYETENSVIREYMSEAEYRLLQRDELNGSIRIMNHVNISSVNRMA